MSQCTAPYNMTTPIYLVSPFTPIYLMSHMECLIYVYNKMQKT